MTLPCCQAALACHPATPVSALSAVELALSRGPDGALALRYRMSADAGRLRLPPAQPPRRTDDLWQHTCCECFIGIAGETAYREFNFSPSGHWAAYDFDDYRVRRPDLPDVPAPRSQLSIGYGLIELRVELPAGALPSAEAGALVHIGLSVVAEADDGNLSYWALRHPSPRPDFHHRDAFAIELPAHGPIA